MYVAAAAHLSDSPLAIAGVATGVAAYLGFIAWIILGPKRCKAAEDKQQGGEGLKDPLLATGADGLNGGG